MGTRKRRMGGGGEEGRGGSSKEEIRLRGRGVREIRKIAGDVDGLHKCTAS